MPVYQLNIIHAIFMVLALFPENLTSAETILAAGNNSRSDLSEKFSTKDAHGACADADIPNGAMALEYTKRVINLCPTVADISPNGQGHFSLYSGQWYVKSPPELSHYSIIDGILAIRTGGDLTSIPRDFSRGGLPLLPGKEGFYVEFAVRLSTNDPDHWPALWLMPAEHNNIQSDHYEGDPVNFERWLELDVEEGGFGPGFHGAAISWTGIWPHYSRIQNPNNTSKTPLDRTKLHSFGASYDPIHDKVKWYLDGKEIMTATAPYVPKVAKRQNFYLIMGAQSHGLRTKYDMLIHKVRAFVPQRSTLHPM